MSSAPQEASSVRNSWAASAPSVAGPERARSAGLPLFVREMVSDEVPVAADLAARVLDGSLLAALGPTFLAGLFNAALGDAATIGLAATDSQGRLLGFALASRDLHAFERSTRFRLIPHVLQALRARSRWSLIPSFVMNLMETEPRPRIPTELLLLFVEPAAQRRGAGRQLVRHLERVLAGEGIHEYRVAVRSHLVLARAFYVAVGFQFEQELRVLGRPMAYYTHRL